MRKLTLTLSAAALALGGAAAVVHAQPADAPQAQRGRMAPSGPMDRATAETRAQAAFARMDANGDGKLDQTDRAEMKAKMKGKAFDRLDTDNDGKVTREEFTAARDKMRGQGGKRGKGKDGPRMGSRGGPGGQGMMKMADTNGDGSISQSEFVASSLARFDRADADKDGTVTPEERQAVRAQFGGKGGKRAAPAGN